MNTMKRFTFLLALISLISVVLATQQESKGQYLVRFKSSPDNNVRSLTNLGNKVKILKEFTVAKRVTWLVEGEKVDVDKLRESPLVAWIEENVQYTLPTITERARIAKRSNGQGMRYNNAECKVQGSEDGEDIWGLIRTSWEDVPDYNYQEYKWQEGGEGADIYVLDTGVDTRQPDLAGRVAEGYVAEAVRGERDGDMNGHGTYVASVAAGSVYGAAKEARVVPVKVMNMSGIGSLSSIIEGIEWATEQVRMQRENRAVPRAIINLSFEGVHSKSFYEALLHASNTGIAIIAAAGNNVKGSYPGGYNVTIAIGATDKKDNVIASSNHGCHVALYAPGADITGAWSTQSAVLPCEQMKAERCIKTKSGTSASAALAAGILARWLVSAFTDGEMDKLYRHPSYYQDILTSTSVRGRLTFNNDDAIETSHNALLHRTCGQNEWDWEKRIPVCWNTPTTTTQGPVPTSTTATKTTTTTRATTVHPPTPAPSTTPAAASTTHSTTTNTTPEADASASLSVWEILGITAACAACVLLIVVVVMLLRRPAPASCQAPQMVFSNHGYANGPAVLVVDNKGSLPIDPPAYEEVADEQAA